jgi:hypothetical protein
MRRNSANGQSAGTLMVLEMEYGRQMAVADAVRGDGFLDVIGQAANESAL